MPKMKTHSGTKDRVRIKKSGAVVIRKAGGHHKLSKKTKSSRRARAIDSIATGKMARDLKRSLGK
jgi:large subunit ribosomal protein L35